MPRPGAIAFRRALPHLAVALAAVLLLDAAMTSALAQQAGPFGAQPGTLTTRWGRNPVLAVSRTVNPLQCPAVAMTTRTRGRADHDRLFGRNVDLPFDNR